VLSHAVSTIDDGRELLLIISTNTADHIRAIVR